MVVLPEPVSPTIAVVLPAGTTMSTSSSVGGPSSVVGERDALEAHLAAYVVELRGRPRAR